ncbi:MAG: DUF881 domain-containing protein [Candidatus Gracilibacteria bacterium]|nr:DUF881 domain-containing protein [Candidatus Gracilibacteria bacterium]
MKPNHLTSAVFIGTSVLLGFVLVSQLVFTNSYLNSNPLEPYNELQNSIRALSQEQETLQERLALLRDELSNYDQLEVSSTLKKQLESLKGDAGLTEIAGRGIKVTLDDKFSESPDYAVVDNVCYASDLRDIVNLMRAAGVQGIAINNQRITYSASITCVGTSVLVNNVRMLPPFQITSIISNAWTLKNYLSTEKFLPGIYTRLKQNELVFLVEDKADSVLPAYKGNLAFDYLKKTADEI